VYPAHQKQQAYFCHEWAAVPDVMLRVAVGLPAKPKSCHLDASVTLTLFFLDTPNSQLLRGAQNPPRFFAYPDKRIAKLDTIPEAHRPG